MKKFLTLAKVLAVSSALPVLLGADRASAQSIVGTPHDLSGRGWGTNQICVFCHAPHNAASGANQIVPLWNHGTTTATFTVYSSTSLNATPGQPGSNSKACLSCHDGTVALDTYGQRTGTNFLTGAALLGTDISNDHPVSFVYDTALATADGGLVAPASSSAVVTGIPLFNSRLECASCHAVHNNQHGDFLRATNAGSALCLRCHSK